VRIDSPELITFGGSGRERVIKGVILFVFTMGLHPGGDLALHVLFSGRWGLSETRGRTN
jgi:hypothetical protein